MTNAVVNDTTWTGSRICMSDFLSTVTFIYCRLMKLTPPCFFPPGSPISHERRQAIFTMSGCTAQALYMISRTHQVPLQRNDLQSLNKGGFCCVNEATGWQSVITLFSNLRIRESCPPTAAMINDCFLFCFLHISAAMNMIVTWIEKRNYVKIFYDGFNESVFPDIVISAAS